MPTQRPQEYAELHVRSAFSFGSGASTPERLAEEAARKGLRALALTDLHDAGAAVRFSRACREQGITPILGTELSLDGGPNLILLCLERRGWKNICTLITRSRQESRRGFAKTSIEHLSAHHAGLLCIAAPTPSMEDHLPILQQLFPDRLYLEVCDHGLRSDIERVRATVELCARRNLPSVITNDVRHARAEEKIVSDTLQSNAMGMPLDQACSRLFPNAERHIRSPEEVFARWRGEPRAIRATLDIADRCTFRLEELKNHRLELPSIAEHPMKELTQRLQTSFTQHRMSSPTFRAQVRHELGVIERLGLANYFLIVDELVRFARSRQILVQGRGSAASSAICYALGITAIDPVKEGLLFERFLCNGRPTLPDIDLDIAHQDREEILQYAFKRFDRDRAAMTCSITTWQGASATKAICLALGIDRARQDIISRELRAHSPDTHPQTHRQATLSNLRRRALKRADIEFTSPLGRTFIRLVGDLIDLPRHRTTHVGGLVLSSSPLNHHIPLEPNQEGERSTLQWDRQDLEEMGILKFDLLGLGMLTVIGDSLKWINREHSQQLSLSSIPKDDPKVYRKIREADTIGVFQVESRSQMNVLPRTQPRSFYDLVIQIALIRPGPIQAQMVHPYIRRRRGEERVRYAHPSLIPILKRTLGVPLFQEQAIQIAMVTAHFTPSEAERLRRGFSSKHRCERTERLERRFMHSMKERGIETPAREAIFEQLSTFAGYGFPECHASSFATLVYASAWLKTHFPDVFFVALLNAQPMGFYSLASLIADARRQGVTLARPDIQRSQWPCTLESHPQSASGYRLRFGLSFVRGLGSASRAKVLRGQGALNALGERATSEAPAQALACFADKSGLSPVHLSSLARAGAFDNLIGSHGRARLAFDKGLKNASVSPVQTEADVEPPHRIQKQRLLDDYQALGASLGPHPVTLIRQSMKRALMPFELPPIAALKRRPGGPVQLIGIVSSKHSPMTAPNVLFLALEDETGIVNLVVQGELASRCRATFRDRACLLIEGQLQRHQDALSILLRSVTSLADLKSRVHPS